MKFFKKPFVAFLICVLVVVISSAVTISTKLNNKCEEIIDSFYVSTSSISTSIYADIVKMYELAEEVVVVADNYGVDTRELVKCITDIKDALNFKNPDTSEIYDAYTAFCSSLWTVEVALSDIQLSQRHAEYMNSASTQIYNLKVSVEGSDYNSRVKVFYKRFDRFPVNYFADTFDIEYPEYFA